MEQDYIKDKAHLCVEPKNFKMVYDLSEKKTEELAICYAPKLELGSIINLQNDPSSEYTQFYPSGYISEKSIDEFILGSFVKID
jgi:hypothetical protein